MKALSSQMLQHRTVIYRIPLLENLLALEHFNPLASLFEARVYLPMAVICSAAEQADRVVILTKGNVAVTKDGERKKWAPGEAVGYSCVVHHRWARTAVALDAAETIELPRALYCAFLRDAGAFEQVHDAILSMMFPDSGSKKDKKRAAKLLEKATAGRQTPLMFPVFEGETERSASKFGLVPQSVEVTALMGGLGATVAPGRLSAAERKEIEDEVALTFNADHQRRLIKITQFLWLKQKGVES